MRMMRKGRKVFVKESGDCDDIKDLRVTSLRKVMTIDEKNTNKIVEEIKNNINVTKSPNKQTSSH